MLRTPLVRGVGLLKEKYGLAPPAGADTKKVDSNAQFLRLLHSNAKVFIPGKQNGIRHRPVPRQSDDVRYDQRIDALLFADAVDKSQPHFQIVQVG